jgi:hypothetical protein
MQLARSRRSKEPRVAIAAPVLESVIRDQKGAKVSVEVVNFVRALRGSMVADAMKKAAREMGVADAMGLISKSLLVVNPIAEIVIPTRLIEIINPIKAGLSTTPEPKGLRPWKRGVMAASGLLWT